MGSFTGRRDGSPAPHFPPGSPGPAAILIRYVVQAAEGVAQVNPPPDSETPGGYTRRLVTAVLRLLEQRLLLIPPDLEQRLAVQAEADDSTDKPANIT